MTTIINWDFNYEKSILWKLRKECDLNPSKLGAPKACLCDFSFISIKLKRQWGWPRGTSIDWENAEDWMICKQGNLENVILNCFYNSKRQKIQSEWI